MSEVKTYLVTGEVLKKQFFEPMRFSKEIKAAKMEHAVEQIYSEIGSRHRAKRSQITIISVEEIEPTSKAGN